MSAEQAADKKHASLPRSESIPKETPEEAVSNAIIADLDRVHVRTPRY
ncbi:MAG: hypothetical protein LBK52_05625 [Deltaproteobacteria bacterium]|jgi:hypothetical protein|nr:hypothetical protein [Deltaproteobacteria bacterium]